MVATPGGLAALLDRKVVTQCPVCDTDNPDLENRGYCAACGAVFRDKVRRRMRIVQVAVALGIGLTAGGAALVLLDQQRWIGLAIYIVGILPLGFAVLAGHQIAGSLLAALSLRATTDTQRTLRRNELLSTLLFLYFLAAFAGCIPYYLYIERPRQQENVYQDRFASHLTEYRDLVKEDTKVDRDAKPYLVGKAVAVEERTADATINDVHIKLPNIETGLKVGEVQAALPPVLRAETPEEVGTVLLVQWKNAYYGPYGETGAKGFRINAELTIINKADQSVLWVEKFEGAKPPADQPHQGHGFGPKPIAKIVAYLAGLEKK